MRWRDVRVDLISESASERRSHSSQSPSGYWERSKQRSASSSESKGVAFTGLDY